MKLLLSIGQKYPELKRITEFKNYFNERIMDKDSQCQLTYDSIPREEKSEDEQNLCSPLSPSGSPFILDISDIQTAPTTEKKYFLNIKSQRLFANKFNSADENLSENETNCKQSENSRVFTSRVTSSNKLTAAEMLKKLKNNLINLKPHRRNRSLMHLVYSLFDKYQ